MPVAAVALLGLVPTAARRVNMSLVQLFRDAIWPALWPAVIAACLLLFTRDHLPARLPSLALQIAVGAAAYVSMFLLAVGAEGRREYMRHANVLLKRPSRQMSQIGTANAS
jgi:hypothetical protein